MITKYTIGIYVTDSIVKHNDLKVYTFFIILYSREKRKSKGELYNFLNYNHN